MCRGLERPETPFRSIRRQGRADPGRTGCRRGRTRRISTQSGGRCRSAGSCWPCETLSAQVPCWLEAGEGAMGAREGTSVCRAIDGGQVDESPRPAGQRRRDILEVPVAVNLATGRKPEYRSRSEAIVRETLDNRVVARRTLLSRRFALAKWCP